MKKYLVLLIAFVLLVFNSCGTQNYLDSATVNKLIDSEEFTFVAKRAHPTSFDAITVINSLPGTSTGQMLNLDYGYDIVLKDKQLISTLPYFGRAYTPSMDRETESMRFTSKNYRIQKSSGKKNAKILTFIPEDVQHIRRVIMEIFPNGRAYVSIDASDRQPISYDGYIEQVKN